MSNLSLILTDPNVRLTENDLHKPFNKWRNTESNEETFTVNNIIIDGVS